MKKTNQGSIAKRRYTKLLINEPPLQVIPSLAKAIGLNEAMMVQQIHYWTERSRNVVDGHLWVYKTAEEWREEFPFWSVKTIRRIIESCESWGIIKSGVFNKMKMDRTKWYRIDYNWLGQFEDNDVDNLTTCSGQPDQMEVDSMTTAIPETTSKTTTEITSKKSKEEEFSLFLDEFNKVTGKKIRVLGDKAKRQYTALTKSGITLEEILKASRNLAEHSFFKDSNNRKYVTPEFITRGDKFAVWIDAQPEKQTGAGAERHVSTSRNEEDFRL